MERKFDGCLRSKKFNFNEFETKYSYGCFKQLTATVRRQRLDFTFIRGRERERETCEAWKPYEY
jgi:hypothetical protein